MPLASSALEAVDDAGVPRFAAVAHTMFYPASTSSPTIPAILFEDLPAALPVQLHCLRQDVVGLISAGRRQKELAQLRGPAIVSIIRKWLVLWEGFSPTLALWRVEAFLALACGFWRWRTLITSTGPTTSRLSLLGPDVA